MTKDEKTNQQTRQPWEEISCEEARQALLETLKNPDEENVSLTAKAIFHLVLCDKCRAIIKQLDADSKSV